MDSDDREPSISDYEGKDWDSPEVEDLVECVLAWYTGTKYYDFAEAYDFMEPPRPAPSTKVFYYAERFQGYVVEALARFITEHNWEEGVELRRPHCECGVPCRTYDIFVEHVSQDHPGETVTWHHQ